jgi:hypothetical protein
MTTKEIYEILMSIIGISSLIALAIVILVLTGLFI